MAAVKCITALAVALSVQSACGFLTPARLLASSPAREVGTSHRTSAQRRPMRVYSMMSDGETGGDLAATNQVILIGRLGAEPQVKYLDSGNCVLGIGLAVQKGGIPGSAGSMGEGEECDWVQLDMWGGLAESFAQTARKGSRVLVFGKLVTNKWTDKYGQSRTDVKVRVKRAEVLQSSRSNNPELKYNSGWEEYPVDQQEEPEPRQPRKFGGSKGGYTPYGGQGGGRSQGSGGAAKYGTWNKGGGQQQRRPMKGARGGQGEGGGADEQDYEIDDEVPF